MKIFPIALTSLKTIQNLIRWFSLALLMFGYIIDALLKFFPNNLLIESILIENIEGKNDDASSNICFCFLYLLKIA